MDHFDYRDGILHAEGVAVPDIAAAVGTPFYLYSAATFRRHVQLFDQALAGLDHRIFYAMKANGNLAILTLMRDLGVGIDVVSGGEYAKARAAGIPGERIVFAGVGKTGDEMALALKGGIHQFNVESEAELDVLDQVALSLGTTAPVALRVNPDVDARTHAKIATGKAENKFGIPRGRIPALYRKGAGLAGIRMVGLDMHIGSQLTDLAPFRAAFRRMADLVRGLRAEGLAVARLDLGGGLGIPYARDNRAPPLPVEYGAVIREELGDLGCEIAIEPGRLIAGNAGILVAQVIYLKRGEGRDFLIVDAAMNDLVRPAMYEAHHDIVPVVAPPPGTALAPVDVVGPVCETGDTFARGRDLPPLAPGDLIAFRSAGAYGAVMASEYNMRPLVPEVLVDGDQFAVIRPRPSFDEMINRDKLPPWMQAAQAPAG